MIWVYGICDRPDTPPPPLRGLAQAPLYGITEGPLLAVVSRHVHSPGEPAVDALWAHERVIDRLMAEHTVLPMRFGSRVVEEAQLRAVLRDRMTPFIAALDRVRGRVELGVRALAVAGSEPAPDAATVSAPAPALTGRDYLLGKLRDGRQADQAGQALHEPLALLAVEARRSASRSSQEVLRASYLVARAAVAPFRTAVERLQAAHADTAILCTGPWPPYSFVDDAAHDVGAAQPMGSAS